jgi:hypothetical protein
MKIANPQELVMYKVYILFYKKMCTYLIIFLLFIEIEEQASRLGIDPVKELHLLSIAKQCLLEPLPSNWIPWYYIKIIYPL